MEENGYGLIIEKTARELVFGYEDPLLVILNEYLPFLVPTTTFGYFYGQNNTFSKDWLKIQKYAKNTYEY